MLTTVLLVLFGVFLVLPIPLWIYGERGRLLRGSTWRMMREAGLRRFLNFSGLHGYVYGRWIKEYLTVLLKVICPRLGPRGRKWLANHYHGKVLTPDLAHAIVTVDRDIPLQDLAQIIPYSTARDLVLKAPPDIAVFQCGCRQTRKNPCQPIQVCMVIGQPFVDFILEHHPKTSRRLSQAEALDLLRAEEQRGHLHSAWFKDAALGRFYSICNCCKCCCGGIEAMGGHGVACLAPSGYVAEPDPTLCVACGTCEAKCPFEAVRVNGSAQIDWEKCMGCGLCVGQCPNDALSLNRDERKGIPLDVRLLAEEQAGP